MDEVIRTVDLEVGYRNKAVLGPVNLRIMENELLTIIGTNGSGKSTLIKTLAGILQRVSGGIFLDNKELKGFSIKELSTRRAILFSNFDGYVNYQLKELLAISRYPFTNWLGKLTEYDKEMIDRSLYLTNLKDLEGRMIYELSDGEKQRLSIARAYCQDTDLIFLDEPFVHLDLRQKELIYKLILSLVKAKGKTIALATHDLGFAKKYSSRVLAINPYKSIDTISPDDLDTLRINKIFGLTQPANT